MKKCFWVICVCGLLTACTVFEKGPVEKLEDLAEEIRMNHQEYTVTDWKRAYARYEEIAQEMEEYRFSPEERRRIGVLEGECVRLFMNSAVGSLDGLEDEVNGFIEGLTEGTKALQEQ